jgi:hypothetical protein
VLLSGAIFALYLSRPQSGLGHEIIDMIEFPISDNDAVRYNAHNVLGKVFSLCPCTAGLSADQYRRASFHRPTPTATP